MNEDTHSKLMAIKQSFRLFMDGTTSRSMAQKGLGYKINWGVPFHELRKMAMPYAPNYDLAIELWKENIRLPIQGLLEGCRNYRESMAG